MGPLDFLLHLINFAAPALVLGPLVDLSARAGIVPGARARTWWKQWLFNIAAGLGVLVAGLLLTGQDGKIVTYAALVVVVASVQWLAGRGWRNS